MLRVGPCGGASLQPRPPPPPLPPTFPETPSFTLGVKLLSSLLKLQY